MTVEYQEANVVMRYHMLRSKAAEACSKIAFRFWVKTGLPMSAIVNIASTQHAQRTYDYMPAARVSLDFMLMVLLCEETPIELDNNVGANRVW